MSRNSFGCLFCGETLARVRPKTGQIKPLGPVAYEVHPPSTVIVVTCPRCGEKREFDCRPQDELKPAA